MFQCSSGSLLSQKKKSEIKPVEVVGASEQDATLVRCTGRGLSGGHAGYKYTVLPKVFTRPSKTLNSDVPNTSMDTGV